MSALHDLATLAGATVLGDPPQYLFSQKQLARLLDMVTAGDATALIRLHDLLEKEGKKVQIFVDSQQ